MIARKQSFMKIVFENVSCVNTKLLDWRPEARRKYLVNFLRERGGRILRFELADPV